MSADEGKEMVRRRFMELDHGNFAILDELFRDDYILSFPGDVRPLSLEQQTKNLYAALYSAFPDLRHTIEDEIAEADKIVTRWLARGTHRGELMGIEPTNRRITLSGINIYRIADGKLAESHVSWDILGLLRQLGGVPPTPLFPGELQAAAD